MTDEQLLDRFTRLEWRLERLDTKTENLEQGLADVKGECRARFEGFETRLARKADTWVVTAGFTLLALLITAYTCVV
jgi:hypothetical protein